jgi:O-antigen ligase
LLPVIFYFFWVSTGWHKIVFVAIGILNIDILLQSKSRPAILAIIFSVFFVGIFQTKKRNKWIIILLMVCFCTFIYFTDYAGVSTVIQDLIVNFTKEERWLIWRESWMMLKDNSLVSWIFGNGIGSFRIIYPDYTSVPRFRRIVSPHSYLFGILYESGIAGFILVFGGFALLLISAAKALKTKHNENEKILIKCMLVNLLSWLIHNGFTVPFYSKYSQYPLAFILGTLLAVIEHPASRKVKPTTSQNITLNDRKQNRKQ